MTQNPKFHRVLLVGSFSWFNANGITVHNLFSRWPPVGLLSMISTNIDDISEVYSNLIQDYYFLGNKETYVKWPLSLMFKASPSKYLQIQSKEDLQSHSTIKSNKPITKKVDKKKSFLLSIRYKLIYLLGLRIRLKKRNISPELNKWITRINPDFIYCTSSSIDEMDFAISLKKEFPNSHLIFHTFDDFIHSRYQETLCPIYWKYQLKKNFTKLLRYTDLNLTISQKMANEYHQKYGKEFYSFHNTVDLPFWQSKTKDNTDLYSKSFTFLYTGKINEDTGDVIKLFYSGVKQLKNEGINVQFKIFSTTEVNILKLILGSLTEEISIEKIGYNELPERMVKADALLLPLNSNKQTIKYIRLSMPTKATEYMAIRKPIFLFTPRNIAVTEYLIEHDAAFFVDSNSSVEKVKSRIRDFISDSTRRNQITDNAYNLCVERHTIESVTERLLSLMNKVYKL